MLLNRYRRWKYALAEGPLGRVWREEVRPARRVARARGQLRGLRRRLADLAYLLRLERVVFFIQFGLGFALAAPRWDLADIRLLVLAVFCLGPCLYGGLYALNDAADAARDRLHPAKRLRPVASGRIPVPQARRIGLGLVALGLALALLVDGRVFAVGLMLALLNILYTHLFKHVRWLDMVFNAATHPLRLAGGLWLAGGLAHWPVLAVSALVILSNCSVKRLYELRTAPPASRPVLRRYSAAQLLRFTAICQGAALGLLPFLTGADLVVSVLALIYSFIVLAGHRLPIASRIMRWSAR